MRIPINKDIEEEYKDQLALGFSAKELGWLILAILFIAGVTFLCWKYLGISPDVGVFIGIPFGAIPVVIGMKKIQGQSVIEFLKELNYERKTKELYYDADELPHEHYVYSLKKESRGKRK
ncbi:MAG: PrgI family protein [Agathobacter sp.]|nr:PrgI family protein [Agathobacter sp.]